jgi:hypothetical protein
MATVNFFRIMLGLPSLNMTSTDPGLIPCDGGSLSATGNDGVYNFRAITVGNGIGFVDTKWNSYGRIDRFQVIWNNQIVCDSLFVGDNLSGNPGGEISYLQDALNTGFTEYNWNDSTGVFDSTGNTITPNVTPIPSTTYIWEGGSDGSDDRIVYNIAPTGSLYNRNDNSGQTPAGTGGNAPSQGYYESVQSSPLAAPASGAPASFFKQIGVVTDYPNSTAKSWDGNIKLSFYKDAQFPEIIEMRVWGIFGTGWDLEELTCPGGGYETMVGLASKNGPAECTNYGSYSYNSIPGTFPWNIFSYANETVFHEASIGASSNLTIGDELYTNANLSNPASLIGVGGFNLGKLNINNNSIVPAPGSSGTAYDNSNGQNNPQVPGFNAWYKSTTSGLKIGSFWNEVVFTGSNAGVITGVTNTYVWEEILMKYVASAGNNPQQVNCGLTSSITPDTTYYFNSQRNKGMPGYGDKIFSGNPGQPTGTNLSPWGEYPENTLDQYTMTEGWYVAAANTGCKNAGMPAKVLIYVQNVNGYFPVVTKSPMAFNTSPCF